MSSDTNAGVEGVVMDLGAKVEETSSLGATSEPPGPAAPAVESIEQKEPIPTQVRILISSRSPS